MSHNKIKIGNSAPNRESEVSVGFNDLSDVSASSPADGQVMKYVSSSSSWEAVSAPSADIQYIWAGGKAKSYSNSPASSIASGQIIYIWDDAPVNTISGATLDVTSGSGNSDENNWITDINLPAGKYVFRVQSMFEFSASGYAVYCMRLYSGGTLITNYGVVGENRGTNYGPSNSTSVGYYEFTSTTRIQLKLIAVSNVDSIANQGNTPSEFGLIYIEKLS